MAELNKKTDQQFTTANPTNDTANVPRQSALRDWIEGCRVPARNATGPRLVPRGPDNAQGLGIPTPVAPAAPESARGTFGAATPLLPASKVGELRLLWNHIEAGFLDEPRRSVEEANKLLANAVQLVAEGFARERASLERQWESEGNVSTEELRLALKRYRAFFSRFLDAA